MYYRLIALALLLSLSLGAVAGIPVPENPGWIPVPDDVYLQESARHILTESPLNAVAVLKDTAYVGNANGIFTVSGDTLLPADGPQAAVTRLRTIGGMLWAVASNGLWRFDGQSWTHISTEPIVDICLHRDKFVAVTGKQVYTLQGNQLTPLLAKDSSQHILGVQSYSETIYVRHAGQLGFLKGDRIEYYEVEDWNYLPPGSITRDMKSMGNHVLVATDKGLGELRGASWHIIQGEQGLPYEDTTCVASGFARDYWVGTMRGAARYVDGEFHFYGKGRWLPGDQVHAIAVSDTTVYLATDAGLAVIEFLPYTLQKKAANYKQILYDSGMIRLGMVTILRYKPDGSYERWFGDNDIGFSCHLLDALCFEYAVTKDPKVREQAVDIFKTVKWSEEITPIDGFPARTMHAVGEAGGRTNMGSAGRAAEWNTTEDGIWVWKGDTSSDEMVAQTYAVSLFHDLVAQGKEKEAAREHLERMMNHLADNEWGLIDLDGKPTVWAQWGPGFVLSPEHVDERGLNSLQALSFIAIAERLFPGPKFTQAKQDMIGWGYVDNMQRQKRTFPHYTRFDDRLAFLAYYPLLRYETDPEIRAAAMRSLQRSWEIKRIEKQSWFNYIYGALSGNDCEAEEAADHLRAYPLDTFSYPYTNSHRHDLHNPEEYINYLEDWHPFTPRDNGWMRWNRSFQQLDGGGGMAVADPSGWLDAYWMGRYYGMIAAPTTEDPALLTVEPRRDFPLVPPYDGPPRPDIF